MRSDSGRRLQYGAQVLAAAVELREQAGQIHLAAQLGAGAGLQQLLGQARAAPWRCVSGAGRARWRNAAAGRTASARANRSPSSPGRGAANPPPCAGPARPNWYRPGSGGQQRSWPRICSRRSIDWSSSMALSSFLHHLCAERAAGGAGCAAHPPWASQPRPGAAPSRHCESSAAGHVVVHLPGDQRAGLFVTGGLQPRRRRRRRTAAAGCCRTGAVSASAGGSRACRSTPGAGAAMGALHVLAHGGQRQPVARHRYPGRAARACCSRSMSSACERGDSSGGADAALHSSWMVRSRCAASTRWLPRPCTYSRTPASLRAAFHRAVAQYQAALHGLDPTGVRAMGMMAAIVAPSNMPPGPIR